MATKKPTKKPATGKAQNRVRGATSAQAIAAMRRKDEAIDLKADGLSFAQIGDRLGISRQAAHKLVMSAIDEEREERPQKVAQLIEVSNRRLMRLMVRYFPDAEKGDLAALGAVLKLEERFAKLNGLDAATRTELSGPEGAPLQSAVFAIPLTAPSVSAWTAEAQNLAAAEEAAAEALLEQFNATSNGTPES